MKLLVFAPLFAAMALFAGSANAVVEDAGFTCSANSQGTFQQFYVNGVLTTYYCSNSGDPINGPFKWIR